MFPTETDQKPQETSSDETPVISPSSDAVNAAPAEDLPASQNLVAPVADVDAELTASSAPAPNTSGFIDGFDREEVTEYRAGEAIAPGRESVASRKGKPIPPPYVSIPFVPSPSGPPAIYVPVEVHPGAHTETWGANEIMRHVPTVEWLRLRIDRILRSRFERAWAAYATLPGSDPRHAAFEVELRAFSRSVDRIAEAARSRHGNIHPPNELRSRIVFALDHALAAINSLDPNLFGRRFPVQSHEKSKAEGLYGAVLAASAHLERVLTNARLVDPDLDEHLLEGLVVLSNPVDDRMLVPIA